MKPPALLLALSLCLILCACGAGTHRQPPPAAEPSPLGQAAGTDPQATLLTVGGTPVPAWQFLYWLAADCRRLEERYAAAGEPLDWSAPVPEGGTLADLAKSAALADTVLCATVERWAEVYGCALDDAQTAALPRQTHPWLTEAQGRCLSRQGQEYAALFALYCQAGSPLAPTEAELTDFEAHSGLLAAEQIFISAEDDAAAREAAGAAFAALNAAQDPQAVFQELTARHGGGPLTEADWLPALQEAAEMLEVGQWSGIIAAGGGYSILRRTPLPRQTLLEGHFDRLLQESAQAQEILVTADYETIDPQAFWRALSGTQTP